MAYEDSSEEEGDMPISSTDTSTTLQQEGPQLSQSTVDTLPRYF